MVRLMAMDNDQARPPRPEGEGGDEGESAWDFEPQPAGRQPAPEPTRSEPSSGNPGMPLRPDARGEDESAAVRASAPPDGTPASPASPASNDPGRPRMTWDEMVSTPAESGSIVDAMRQWADKTPDELEPRRGRRLLGEVEIQQPTSPSVGRDAPAASPPGQALHLHLRFQTRADDCPASSAARSATRRRLPRHRRRASRFVPGATASPSRSRTPRRKARGIRRVPQRKRIARKRKLKSRSG